MENISEVTEFLFLGLTQNPELQPLLFAFFFAIYLVTLLGNSTIVLLIFTNHQLQTPMYFFLGNLSLVDICFSTVTAPLLLANLVKEKKTIAFSWCMTQLFFFICTVCTECFVLALMAYDRLIAISNPLQYLSIMNKMTCLALIAGSWALSSLHAILHTTVISSMKYCGPNKINGHFCDIPTLLALSCSSTADYDILVFTEGCIVAINIFIFVLVSYFHIIKTILTMKSSSGKYQAFSTCSSHMTSVGLFFGTSFFTYIRPSSSGSVEEYSYLSVVYSMLTPLLNPFIYSLRNQQMSIALKKIFHQSLSYQKGRYSHHGAHH